MLLFIDSPIDRDRAGTSRFKWQCRRSNAAVVSPGAQAESEVFQLFVGKAAGGGRCTVLILSLSLLNTVLYIRLSAGLR